MEQPPSVSLLTSNDDKTKLVDATVCPLLEEESGSEAGLRSDLSTACGDESGSETEQAPVSPATAVAKRLARLTPPLQDRSPLCLVLDIDGTMLSEAEGVGVNTMGSMLRPFLQEFLDFAFNSFSGVAIWTAANQEWLDAFLAAADPEGKRPWAFKWTYERVTKKFVDNDPECGIEAYWKDLRKIWRNKALRSLGYSPQTTLIVDNSPGSCRTCKSNAIFIKTYGVEDENYAESPDSHGDDDWLAVLTTYLQLLSQRVDTSETAKEGVREIDKSRWYLETRALAEVENDEVNSNKA